jgi:D-3-phosphoglycerate dehydrogenase
MAKILITDGMDKSAVKQLKDLGFEVTEQFYPEPELIQAISKFDAVVVRSATKITKPVIDGSNNGLKLIVRGGVGVDNIEVAHAEAHHIKVQNTPGASSDSVAELALGLMFAVARQIPQADATMKAGKFEKKAFAGGVELAGKTLGIIGMGRIGASLARMATALGMKVLGHDKFPETARSRNVPMMTKDELLPQCDYISLHIPYDKVGGAELTAREFAMMKDGVIVINCARGGVVDEEALLAALNSGKVRGAGIDVWVGEPNPRGDLAKHPKVVALPHIGAATGEAQGRVGGEVVQILKEFFKK